MIRDRFTSRTTVAAICTGILLLLLAGVAGTRCGREAAYPAPVVIVDTVKVAADSAAARPHTSKKRKKKPKAPPPPPRQRNYRDETVSPGGKVEG